MASNKSVSLVGVNHTSDIAPDRIAEAFLNQHFRHRIFHKTQFSMPKNLDSKHFRHRKMVEMSDSMLHLLYKGYFRHRKTYKTLISMPSIFTADIQASKITHIFNFNVIVCSAQCKLSKAHGVMLYEK